MVGVTIVWIEQFAWIEQLFYVTRNSINNELQIIQHANALESGYVRFISIPDYLDFFSGKMKGDEQSVKIY